MFFAIISLPAVAMSSISKLPEEFLVSSIVISTLNACHIMMKGRKKGVNSTPRGIHHPGDMNNSKERRRLYFFILFLSALALLILGRLMQLMIFTPQSDAPDSITLPVVERGPILDRNGKILAISTRLDSVAAWIPDVADPNDSAKLLAHQT